MSEVFVSYSRKDQAFVDRLCGLIERADLGVWVDHEGLYAGEEFWPDAGRTDSRGMVRLHDVTRLTTASFHCQTPREVQVHV